MTHIEVCMLSCVGGGGGGGGTISNAVQHKSGQSE